MLNSIQPYGPRPITVHERTAGAPKVSFALTVLYHPVHYGGMGLEAAAAKAPILKKPFLFDLDVAQSSNGL